MNYWLMKSEPSCYSIDDLQKDKKTMWDGVRNYQARNFMKNDMRESDVVFFYHSNAKEIGIAGEGRVCSRSYPDPTAFDKKDEHYDPKSDPENPRWYLVDVCFVKMYREILTLNNLKADPKLEGILVARQGNRLSIMPVNTKHGAHIQKLAT